MSAREWKPGQVALVRGKRTGIELFGFRVFDDLRGIGGWRSDDDGFACDDDVEVIRPVVWIDPEDRKQVERLLAALERMWFSTWARGAATCLATALREFADPKPPRPAEPQGLGAVVEDADGFRATFARVGISGTHLWYHERDGFVQYADIAVTRVLSEGVTEGAES